MSNIREEFFLVAEVETIPLLPPAYYFKNSKKDRKRATAINTLPPNYQGNVDKYNKINNKHFVGVWNTEKQRWETVSVPPYAEDIVYCGEEDDEVMDVYDMDSGTYKRRGSFNCAVCNKEMIRCLYIVRGQKVLRACSFECVENLRRCEKAEREADRIIEKAQEKEKEDLSAYACKICGKIPTSIETAIASIHTSGDPEDSAIYMLACSFGCALKLKEEYDSRKRL